MPPHLSLRFPRSRASITTARWQVAELEIRRRYRGKYASHLVGCIKPLWSPSLSEGRAGLLVHATTRWRASAHHLTPLQYPARPRRVSSSWEALTQTVLATQGSRQASRQIVPRAHMAVLRKAMHD